MAATSKNSKKPIQNDGENMPLTDNDIFSMLVALVSKFDDYSFAVHDDTGRILIVLPPQFKLCDNCHRPVSGNCPWCENE